VVLVDETTGRPTAFNPSRWQEGYCGVVECGELAWALVGSVVVEVAVVAEDRLGMAVVER
jgi:hypothetical protein